MERNEVAQFPILEFHKVYDIIRVHTVSIDIDTAEVRFNSFTSANPILLWALTIP